MTQAQKRAYRLLYSIVWPFFCLFHPVRAVGREHIPEGAAVVCPNHTGLSDPLFVAFAFQKKFPMRVMAKVQLMRVPVLGWLLSKAGIFGVDRGSADMKAAKTAIRALREGNKLLMFPEGTRVGEGENVEAKAGAAMFATRTGSPLIPVYVPAKKRWFRPTTVVIGEPYLPKTALPRATAEENQAIAHEIMRQIQALGEGQ